ncbi:hypothetical protein HanIR_Chr03g0124721 [Helianthus annuus]|nr:hypothetical protein HanIR_Chr03g0124721 [Helianthus annuus]
MDSSPTKQNRKRINIIYLTYHLNHHHLFQLLHLHHHHLYRHRCRHHHTR